jgi:hypothetical protein
MIGLEVKEARVFVRPGATDRDCCTTDSRYGRLYGGRSSDLAWSLKRHCPIPRHAPPVTMGIAMRYSTRTFL